MLDGSAVKLMAIPAVISFLVYPIGSPGPKPPGGEDPTILLNGDILRQVKVGAESAAER